MPSRGPIRDADGRLYPDGGYWTPVFVKDVDIEKHGDGTMLIACRIGATTNGVMDLGCVFT